MSESNREWSVAEVTFGEVPTTDVVIDPIAGTPVPVPVKARPNAYEALVEALRGWSTEYDLPFDESDLIVDTDDDGDLRVVLPAITMVEGDILPKRREYTWRGTVTIEVSVSGTVTAADEDEADEQVSDILRALTIDGVELSSWDGEVDVDGFYESDTSIDDIDEV